MKALIQRVKSASVEVDGEIVGEIGSGLLVFLGVGRGDTREVIPRLAEKVVELRIFPDKDKPMNRSLRDVEGEILLVSQFTLYADCRRGRRPSFEPAADPELARELYREFAKQLEVLGFPPQEGVFAAHMEVRLQNDGPVTIALDSRELFESPRKR